MKLAPYVPNALTLSRLALCPLIVYCQITQHYLWGVGLFIAAGLSDVFDGYVARRYGFETELGALLDPVCDKLLILSFFTFLMTCGSCPPWFLGLLLAIVLLQSMGFLLVQLSPRGPRTVLRPLPAGKWNMGLQFGWIGILFADILLRHYFPKNFHFSVVFHYAGYGMLSVVQLAVFFRYFYRYRRLLLPDLRLLGLGRA
jgi:cardiolipin synthase (CMP-forming)